MFRTNGRNLQQEIRKANKLASKADDRSSRNLLRTDMENPMCLSNYLRMATVCAWNSLCLSTDRRLYGRKKSHILSYLDSSTSL